MLFQASVRENLRYGRLDATDAAIEDAARAAQADAFIRALPQGYDTPVGPRGARLSGGQRQRLALARALLADAPLVILDEATGALDAATEADVLGALRTALADRTVLVVAHRFSTIRQADRIAVLDEGRPLSSMRSPNTPSARTRYALASHQAVYAASPLVALSTTCHVPPRNWVSLPIRSLILMESNESGRRHLPR